MKSDLKSRFFHREDNIVIQDFFSGLEREEGKICCYFAGVEIGRTLTYSTSSKV